MKKALLFLLCTPVFAQTGQLFYPITPCRLVDTRQPNGPLGGPVMNANTTRAFPLMSSSCGMGGDKNDTPG